MTGALRWIPLVLILLAGVVFLLRPAPEGRKRRESLGCGFVLVAGLVWSFVLTRYLGERSAGFRLGFGLAFVLPALVAILRPGRRPIVPAASASAPGSAASSPWQPTWRGVVPISRWVTRLPRLVACM